MPGPLASLQGIDWKKPQQELDRLKSQVDAWTRKQPPYVEVGLATMGGSTQGAVLGGVMGAMTKLDPDGAGKLLQPPTGGNDAMSKQMAAMQSQSPMVQARNFAVMTGVNAGAAMAIKHARGGKDDVRGAMGAAFFSGAAFSAVSGMSQMGGGGANALQSAFSTGVLFALLQGAIYKLGKAFSGPKVEDTNYVKAKLVLQTTGFPQYEKRLKKAQLTDKTIMLWNESALTQAGIPPGPRLLILHHLDGFRQPLKPGLPVNRQSLSAA